MSLALEPETEPRLPDRYEVVDGEIVEVPPMSGFATVVANRLHRKLAVFGESSRLGWPWMEMLFRVPIRSDPRRNRRPDVVFVTFDRWPEDRPLPYRGNAMDVVPDLIVEVASPNDKAEELLEKANEYLEAGARLVWLVFPRIRAVYAYESPNVPNRIFTVTDDLDGGSILPGFRVPMSTLFPPMIPLPPDPDDESPTDEE